MTLSYTDLANFYVWYILTNTPRRLDFKPDTSMGEGKATPEELEYREALLDLVGRLFKVIGKTMKQDLNLTDKIKKVDLDINDFIMEGQKTVIQYIPETWNAGVDEGLSILQKIGKSKDIRKDKVQTEQRDLVIQQQQMNIEDIGLRLRGRLRQRLNIAAIRGNKNKIPSHLNNTLINAAYPPGWTRCMIEMHREDSGLSEDMLRELCLEMDWMDDFNDTQTNTDKMGMAGWLWAHKEALLASTIIGTAVLGDLIGDWVTVGDENVCEDCLDLEARSPYSVLEWPDEPHFGCRCSMENIRLASNE